MNFIYLDHNATTPLSPETLKFVGEHLSVFGNPSSIHWAGRKSKLLIREARQSLSQLLAVSPLEIIFTSGASESNNTVIKTLFLHSNKKHFMCSEVEHPSVIKTMQYIQGLGAKVDFIPVSREGLIDLEFYKKHLTEDTALVSVMLANNETGTLFPVKEMAKLAHEKGAFFHSDCVQALGKIPFTLSDLGIDYASLSGHKFYAMKGTGILFAKKGVPQISLIHGGAQERHRRGGTENLLSIASFGEMARITLRQGPDFIAKKSLEVGQLRNHLEARILSEISDVLVTAAMAPRLSNTTSLILQGVDGETLLMNLDIKGYAVSTGAACSSGNPEPSPVLLAMGLSRMEAQYSLRLSLGWETTLAQIDQFIDDLKISVKKIRDIANTPYKFDLKLKSRADSAPNSNNFEGLNVNS
jgi:cysteine desulfurase